MEQPLLFGHGGGGREDEAQLHSTEEEEEQEPSSTVFLDPRTASEHVYLGGEHEDLPTTGGLLEEGSRHVLPLVKLKGVVLFPGSTLPLIIGSPLNGMNVGVRMDLRRVLDAQSPTARLVVVVNHRGHFSADQQIVGCTAEVRQLRKGNAAGRGAMLLGRQRVLVDLAKRRNGCVPITVLPSDHVPPVPRAVRQGLQAWPAWAAAPYDADALAAHARSLCVQRFPKLAGPALPPVAPSTGKPLPATDAGALQGSGQVYTFAPAAPPLKPLEFSNWLAANLPMASSRRRLLLDAPTAAQRLRAQVDHLDKHMHRIMRCARCTAGLMNARDMFVSTEEGAGGLFCNEYGYVHDSVTFTSPKAGARVRLQRPAQDKHSFYPGYIWWIAMCGRCDNHLGWRFRCPPGKSMQPAEFWGMRRDALTEVLPTPDMMRLEEEVHEGEEEQEGGVRYVEESTTPDEGDFAPPPIDLLQSLYALVGQANGQEGPGDVTLPVGGVGLAQALADITTFIRQNVQPPGAGGAGGAPAPEGEESAEEGNNDDDDDDDEEEEEESTSWTTDEGSPPG